MSLPAAVPVRQRACRAAQLDPRAAVHVHRPPRHPSLPPGAWQRGALVPLQFPRRQLLLRRVLPSGRDHHRAPGGGLHSPTGVGVQPPLQTDRPRSLDPAPDHHLGEGWAAAPSGPHQEPWAGRGLDRGQRLGPCADHPEGIPGPRAFGAHHLHPQPRFQWPWGPRGQGSVPARPGRGVPQPRHRLRIPKEWHAQRQHGHALRPDSHAGPERRSGRVQPPPAGHRAGPDSFRLAHVPDDPMGLRLGRWYRRLRHPHLQGVRFGPAGDQQRQRGGLGGVPLGARRHPILRVQAKAGHRHPH
mmetsp:Transcript_147392/g.257636  ORF Transcript_147392/g.257636 Transcript_147392/m.257636 type:complete len:300 (-) Transcript_147392:908-1807(-)